MSIWRSRTAITQRKKKLVDRYVEARDELKKEREKVCEDNDIAIADLEKEIIEARAQIDILRWVEGSDA
jgi:hypothetical protein